MEKLKCWSNGKGELAFSDLINPLKPVFICLSDCFPDSKKTQKADWMLVFQILGGLLTFDLKADHKATSRDTGICCWYWWTSDLSYACLVEHQLASFQMNFEHLNPNKHLCDLASGDEEEGS